jgi:hypothetical protein
MLTSFEQPLSVCHKPFMGGCCASGPAGSSGQFENVTVSHFPRRAAFGTAGRTVEAASCRCPVRVRKRPPRAQATVHAC